MPWPGAVRLERGTLPLAALKAVALSDPNDVEAKALARYTADLFRAQTGVGLTVSPSPVTTPPAGSVTLLLRKDEPRAHPEQYVLEVTPQSVLVSAPTHAGLFYGLQTLRQLLPIGGESPRALPAVRIDDVPRFAYRGMHLDVGRHFFPVAFVKRYIDLMAMYKMNTFHWHLTEDQGWRIAIEKYPRLTDVGSCRKETILEKNFDPYIGDGTPYCGFYTQDEIREVVAHARSRYVTVIPEIEMPGHSLAALAAYPEYACTPGPFEVATTWGVHADIYCPTEETFGFLRDVLSEVMDLFPGRYIHIGGDEAPKARWEESEIAQEILRREGLADAHPARPASHWVGRDSRRRARPRSHGDVVARHGGRDRGRETGTRRDHDALERRLFRLLSGRPGVRASRHRRLPPARTGVRLRAGSRRVDPN
jgi:hexosaminidase